MIPYTGLADMAHQGAAARTQKSAAKPGAGDGVVLDRPVGNWAPRGASGQVCRAPWGARLIAYTGLMDMAHQGAAARTQGSKSH